MSDEKISAMTPGGMAQGSDDFPAVRGGNNIRVLGSGIADYVGATPLGLNPFAAGVPRSSAWTAFGSPGVTVSESTPNASGIVQALSLKAAYATTPNLQGLYRAAPASPYRVVCAMSSPMGLGSNGNALFLPGMGFYDSSSGKAEIVGPAPNAFGSNSPAVVSVEQYSSISGGPASVISDIGVVVGASPVWLAVQDDGTNISFECSTDGVNFQIVFEEAKASGFMPVYDKIVIAVDPNVATGTAPSDSGLYATFFTYDEGGLNRTLASVYG